MKKAAVITIAGKATRFNESLSRKVHKAIYFEENPVNTLLYHQLVQCQKFEKIIIVTGYMREEVETYVQKYGQQFLDKIIFVYNEHYADYGSGYSLYLGIKACCEMSIDEIVFLEGDLYFDSASFEKIENSDKNILSVNHDLILAKKAVVLYLDCHDMPHYLYSVSHGMLELNDSFQAIYNSGQVWKFIDTSLLYQVIHSLDDAQKKDTNLVIIQKYFEQIKPDEFEIIDFKKWMNCNLVDDYRQMFFAS